MLGANFNGYDVVYGGAGNDVIDAGAGNDQINFTGGNDKLTGGAGADVFRVASPRAGRATLTDFVSGTDHLEIDLTVFASGLSIERTASGSDTLFTFKSGGVTTGLEILVNGLNTASIQTLMPTDMANQHWVIG